MGRFSENLGPYIPIMPIAVPMQYEFAHPFEVFFFFFFGNPPLRWLSYFEFGKLSSRF